MEDKQEGQPTHDEQRHRGHPNQDIGHKHFAHAFQPKCQGNQPCQQQQHQPHHPAVFAARLLPHDLETADRIRDGNEEEDAAQKGTDVE